MTRSRIHGPRKILGELARLQDRLARTRAECGRIRTNAELAYAHRELSRDAERLCLRLCDGLDRAQVRLADVIDTVAGCLLEGEAIDLGCADPRPQRRARKRGSVTGEDQR